MASRLSPTGFGQFRTSKRLDSALSHPQGVGGVSLKALVVDDDPLLRKIIVRALQLDPQIIAKSAADGASALAMVSDRSWIPDILILDGHMPGMSGEDLLRTVRTISHLAPTQVVMLSARIPEEQAEHYFLLGADAVMRKPFGVTEFAGAIRRLLSAGPAFRSPTGPQLLAQEARTH